jgi:hypothetical protein
MDAVPVALRLRGTFIDFRPEMKSEFHHARSTSEPARQHWTLKSNVDDYLHNLIAHTRALPEVYLPTMSHKKDRDWEYGVDSEDADDSNMSTTMRSTHYDSTNMSMDSNDSGSEDEETIALCIDQSWCCNNIGSDQDPMSGMEAYSDGASMSPITTLMICDIPCRTSEQELMHLLTALGFAGTFDFLYIPVKQRGRRHRGNLGYAFVNFKVAEDASRFAASFVNFSFPGCNSKKLSYVKPAACQGYDANMRMHSANKRFQKHQWSILNEPQ